MRRVCREGDNKNPKGQMPNGSDHNAGYECDTNKGIGRTNPAHTGCQPTTTTPPTPPTPPTLPTPPDIGGEEAERCPDGSVKMPGVSCNVVAGVEGERPRPAGVTAPVAAPAEGVLPQTGAGSLDEALGLTGAAILLAGATTLLLRRRREI